MNTASPLDEYSVVEMAVLPSEGQTQSQACPEEASPYWCVRHLRLTILLLNIIPAAIFCGLIYLAIALTPTQAMPNGPAGQSKYEAAVAGYLIWWGVCFTLNIPCIAKGGWSIAVVYIFYTVLLFGGTILINMKWMS
jgi:hypothetical protein